MHCALLVGDISPSVVIFTDEPESLYTERSRLRSEEPSQREDTGVSRKAD